MLSRADGSAAGAHRPSQYRHLPSILITSLVGSGREARVRGRLHRRGIRAGSKAQGEHHFGAPLLKITYSDGLHPSLGQTGQAVVLCPSGLGLFAMTRRTPSGAVVHGMPQVAHFGQRYLIMKTRRRITIDGGASIMALDDRTALRGDTSR